ncbi:hypothetical protein EAS64_14205 [Trebonia kvetii]|uniref:Cytochrome oxidase subunit I profile domain-containing protein n=1 Tax=Trebonia kvetii TaxID=2480626 RepID=A0A6P2C6F6_9ACTN|nr:hypothetical protein EAS64_14205 [Trebonia kvetii]
MWTSIALVCPRCAPAGHASFVVVQSFGQGQDAVFTWNALLTSILVLLAFPVLSVALLVLIADRRLQAHVFSANSGGAMLWQHLFWFFSHPEVHILALPFFGIGPARRSRKTRGATAPRSSGRPPARRRGRSERPLSTCTTATSNRTAGRTVGAVCWAVSAYKTLTRD